MEGTRPLGGCRRPHAVAEGGRQGLDSVRRALPGAAGSFSEMTKTILVVSLIALSFGAIRLNGQAGETPPAWAYPQAQSQQRPPDDGKVYHLDGSTGAFTAAQINDPFAPPD